MTSVSSLGLLTRCIVSLEVKGMDLGRIVASVTIENASDLSKGVRCDALVDTGASLMAMLKLKKP